MVEKSGERPNIPSRSSKPYCSMIPMNLKSGMQLAALKHARSVMTRPLRVADPYDKVFTSLMLTYAVCDFVGSYLGKEQVAHYFKVTVSQPDPVSKTTSVFIF